VFRRFPEADSGVDDDMLLRDAGSNGALCLFVERRENFIDDIRFVHRHALVVHDNDRHTALERNIE
jgi:hypothetical protein